MSSSPDIPERARDATPSSGDGMYDSAVREQDTSLTVQVREQLDGASRQSIEALQRSTHSIFDYVRRNPFRVAIGVAGVAALLAAWSRRANRY